MGGVMGGVMGGMMDAVGRRIVNGLQGGFPIAERPFAEAAAKLDLTEDVPIPRLGRRLADTAATARGDRPVDDTDPLTLFVVVESGDHHVTILDGDRLEPIHRFPSRFALHGGPKFSPDGRFVYVASRDGWVTKFDLHNLVVVAEVRAGINTKSR